MTPYVYIKSYSFVDTRKRAKCLLNGKNTDSSLFILLIVRGCFVDGKKIKLHSRELKRQRGGHANKRRYLKINMSKPFCDYCFFLAAFVVDISTLQTNW